ncbi:phage tail fiber protein [Bradyrhizobium elkanii]|uniref:phage tail fiber protein n=1 Tax=Bradyrhizobium elkanii TaxID=29448 RepID=UPI003514639C
MPISDYAGNNLLNSLLRGVAFPLPAKVYISLHTGDPGRTGVNEVTLAAWPAYIRKDAADGGNVDTGFSAAASRNSKNAKQLIYPVNDGAGNVTVSYWALFDAPTGGNCLAYGPLSSSRTVQPGDVFVVDVNKLTATVN